MLQLTHFFDRRLIYVQKKNTHNIHINYKLIMHIIMHGYAWYIVLLTPVFPAWTLSLQLVSSKGGDAMETHQTALSVALHRRRGFDLRFRSLEQNSGRTPAELRSSTAFPHFQRQKGEKCFAFHAADGMGLVCAPFRHPG